MKSKKFKISRFKFRFIQFLLLFYSRVFIGYRSKDKYKVAKDEKIIVLSNHQTDFDPLCIIPNFSEPIFPIATDNIFAGKFRSKLFLSLGVIAKKKGISDVSSTINIFRRLNNGDSLLLFPEGNRTYAEFQYYMAPELSKIIKKSGATLVLFNLTGGTGISPRFKNKKRHGKFRGKIVRVLKADEIAKMDDETLFKLIQDSLKVFDSELGQKFKSHRRAEYLEREFFVCPVCEKSETLYSKGKYIKCSNCGLKVEYSEDLHLISANKDFKFKRMIEWWNYQKQYISNLEIKPGEIIFSDKKVKLMQTNPYQKRIKFGKGNVSISDTTLTILDKTFDLKDIELSSVVSGRNLIFTYQGNDYTLRGHKRFNPLKYIFLFNKLDTKLKENHADKYYNLEVD